MKSSHEFITDDISLLTHGKIDISAVSSHRQLTDVLSTGAPDGAWDAVRNAGQKRRADGREWGE